MVLLAPLLFSHMQNILELSAPPAHYFPGFSFLNISKKMGRRGKKSKNNILITKSVKLILDVKIDHKIGILIIAVDSYT